MTNLNTSPKKTVQQIKDNLLQHEIDSFLDSIGNKSESTKNIYKKDIQRFLSFFFNNDDIKFLTVESISQINGDDIVRYQKHLVESDYESSTVNRYINAIRSFYKFLSADNKSINREIFNKIKNLKPKKNVKGALTKSEMECIVANAKRMFGYEFSLFLKVAFITAIRQNALLGLKAENIKQFSSKNDKLIWAIEIYDKTDYDKKPIRDSIAKELRDLAGEDGEVFKNLHRNLVNKRFKLVMDECGIEHKERNITFHSIKKTSINHVLDIGGDISMAQKHANHTSPVTTMNYYIERNNTLEEMPSYIIDENIDENFFEKLSKEELLELVRKSSYKTKMELYRISKS